MKHIIIGGVAGGATAAARIRRLTEKDEIILLEKGEYIRHMPIAGFLIILEAPSAKEKNYSCSRLKFSLPDLILTSAQNLRS